MTNIEKDSTTKVSTPSNSDTGCALIVLAIIIFIIISIVSSKIPTTPIEIQGDCTNSIKNVPVQSIPLSPYGSWNIIGNFWNDVNPFPQSPEITIHRVLVAIQERQISHYQLNFEESTKFEPQNTDVNMSGEFVNVQISVLAQDEQTALLQVAARWIPSRIETAYENVSLFYCQQIVLVNSRQALGWEKVRVNVSGWFVRNDQVNLIPYNFSEIYSSLETNSQPADSGIPITPTP